MELRDVEELASTRALQNSAFQLEIDSTKLKLAETTQNLSSIETTNQKLQDDINRVTNDLLNKSDAISELQETLDKANAKYEELNRDFENLVSLNDTQEKENCELKSSVSILEEKCNISDTSNQELTQKCDKLSQEVFDLKDKVLEQETNFPERMENSERVKLLKEKTLNLEDEVNDKKQVCSKTGKPLVLYIYYYP